jgi:DNA-binding HxlR family transcriptional regulator
MVVERLQELQDAGLVNRHVDPGAPIASTYSITPEVRSWFLILSVCG